jgi:hypothetical protein
MDSATGATPSLFPDFDMTTTLCHWFVQGMPVDFAITQEVPP